MSQSATSNPTDIKQLTRDQAITLLSHQQQTLQSQKHTIDQLQHQLDWFKSQLFGEKSERRLVENPDQYPLQLEERPQAAPVENDQKQEVAGYRRGKAKKRRDEGCVSDSGLRFGPDVPMETVRLPVPEFDSSTGEALEVIGWESFYRLSQQPASYVVICYERAVVKNTTTQAIARIDTPSGIFDRSVADVSFLVGMLVDKFQFHLPLYRQHQRLEAAGIALSRATLTNLTRRAIELLEPVYDAQLEHILRSRVLAMDETPIKAGKSKTKKGKMHSGYYWPVYGDSDEIAFVYADGRAHRNVVNIIGNDFQGTIVSDGYAAYARYAAARDGVTSAQCWSHSRRKFIDAENDEPEKTAYAICTIRALYSTEEEIRDKQLKGKEKLAYRVEHSKSVVDNLFAWIEEEINRADLLPTSPFAKALQYLHNRKCELQVFLSDPEVPLDTNHVERKIRNIAMGRRNWLFCWTELGATQVGIIQSLISTCIMHKINPYDYLVDVLQRVQIHPNADIAQLTPLNWKQHFAGNPLRSELHQLTRKGK